MKPPALLMACVLAATQAHSAETTLFDANPEHPWNGLYAALHTNDPLPRELHDEDPERLLTGKPYDSELAALDGFLKRHGEKAIDAPLERAILQSELWAAFDFVSDPTGRYQDNRKEIARRCAEIIRRLALSEAEVAGLADNYSVAVKSKAFPADYDPDHAERFFLPPDLLSANGPWVMMGGTVLKPAAPQHVEAVQGRSVFYVLIRLPGGRAETLAYLRKLANFPQPYIWNEYYASYPYARSPVVLNPDLPQFPRGTQVALVRRMVLPTARGELAVTPITESVQIRVYRKDPKSAEPGDPSNEDFFEADLSPEELFKGAGGLRATTGGESVSRLVFEKPTPFLRGGPGRACNNCHGPLGVLGLQTYAHSFGPARNTPWFEPSQQRSENENTLNWKKGDYTWGLLRGLLDAQEGRVTTQRE